MMFLHRKKKHTLEAISFVQAVAVLLYIGLVSTIIWKGNEWFGNMTGYLGPVMFLTLFCVSALICLFIVFGHAFLLIWEDKKPKDALKLVMFTTYWLLLFLLLVMIIVLLV